MLNVERWWFGLVGGQNMRWEGPRVAVPEDGDGDTPSLPSSIITRPLGNPAGLGVRSRSGSGVTAFGGDKIGRRAKLCRRLHRAWVEKR